jgi:hypothetical protein
MLVTRYPDDVVNATRLAGWGNAEKQLLCGEGESDRRGVMQRGTEEVAVCVPLATTRHYVC